jgi:membrane protease YdiL (CAAX protease family)
VSDGTLPPTGTPVEPPVEAAASVPGGPGRFRWGGYPDIALTKASLRPGGAFAYAVYAIVLNVLVTLAVSTPMVVTVLHDFVDAGVRLTGIDLRTVALAVTALVLILAYALTLAPALVIALVRRVRFAEFVGMRSVRPLQVVASAAGLITFGVAVTVAYSLVMQGFGIATVGNAEQIARAFGTSPFGLFVAFLAVSVVAPFVEEIVFRGVIFAGLRDRWGQVPAILVSGVLFGIVHLDPRLMIPTAVLGMALAWVYTSTRSLWATMIAHSAYNAFTLVLALGVLARLS